LTITSAGWPRTGVSGGIRALRRDRDVVVLAIPVAADVGRIGLEREPLAHQRDDAPAERALVDGHAHRIVGGSARGDGRECA